MQSYLRFLARYGKAYATIEGMQERFSVFKHNYKRISSFNSEVDEWGRSPPFKLGINRFSDMTEQEFVNERLSSGGARPHDAKQRRRERKQRKQAEKRLSSIKQLYPDGSPMPEEETQDGISSNIPDLSQPYSGALPKNKSWYAEGLVTHPYDQGACGACWAFSAASSLETLAMITGTEPKGSLQTYSVQQLMDCDQNNFVCEGGWMYEAYEYTAKHGIVLERDYAPFKASKGSCDTEQIKRKWHFKNVG